VKRQAASVRRRLLVVLAVVSIAVSWGGFLLVLRLYGSRIEENSSLASANWIVSENLHFRFIWRKQILVFTLNQPSQKVQVGGWVFYVERLKVWEPLRDPADLQHFLTSNSILLLRFACHLAVQGDREASAKLLGLVKANAALPVGGYWEKVTQACEAFLAGTTDHDQLVREEAQEYQTLATAYDRM